MNTPRAFRRRGAVVLALLMACGALPAKPAPWYYWRSKVDGRRVCAQVSPGPGWTRDSGPYEGAMCQPRRRVFVLPAR
jgi:hypothetical protein